MSVKIYLPDGSSEILVPKSRVEAMLRNGWILEQPEPSEDEITQPEINTEEIE